MIGPILVALFLLILCIELGLLATIAQVSAGLPGPSQKKEKSR